MLICLARLPFLRWKRPVAQLNTRPARIALSCWITILTVDGSVKIITAWRRPHRIPLVFNGLVDLGCAALVWYLSHFIGLVQAMGIIVGIYIVASGWRLLLMPVEPVAPETTAKALNVHPDPGLGIPGNNVLPVCVPRPKAGSQFVRATDLLWMSTLGIVFLAIHAGRMPHTDDMLGRVSPVVATVRRRFDDARVGRGAHASGARLIWRRVTRPIERLAWSLRLGADEGAARMNRVADRLMGRWLEARFGFSLRLREARLSLPFALLLLLRLGLPVTAFFVAFNPIWGFSWYFNTDSWATGIYQEPPRAAGRSGARQIEWRPLACAVLWRRAMSSFGSIRRALREMATSASS